MKSLIRSLKGSKKASAPNCLPYTVDPGSNGSKTTTLSKNSVSSQSSSSNEYSHALGTSLDDSRTLNELLEGNINLLVDLTHLNKQAVFSIDRKTSWNDLKVQIASKFNFNPSDFEFQVEESQCYVKDFKASTPFGHINANRVLVKSKPTRDGSLEGVEKRALPFEQTVGLKIYLPRNQLAVLRLKLTTSLREVLEQICNDRCLDPKDYVLVRPYKKGQIPCALNMDQSLKSLKTKEIKLMSIEKYNLELKQFSTNGPDYTKSTSDITSLASSIDFKQDPETNSKPQTVARSVSAMKRRPYKNKPAPPPPLFGAKSFQSLNTIGDNKVLSSPTPSTHEYSSMDTPEPDTYTLDSNTNHVITEQPNRIRHNSDSSGYYEFMSNHESPTTCMSSSPPILPNQNDSKPLVKEVSPVLVENSTNEKRVPQPPERQVTRKRRAPPPPSSPRTKSVSSLEMEGSVESNRSESPLSEDMSNSLISDAASSTSSTFIEESHMSSLNNQSLSPTVITRSSSAPSNDYRYPDNVSPTMPSQKINEEWPTESTNVDQIDLQQLCEFKEDDQSDSDQQDFSDVTLVQEVEQEPSNIGSVVESPRINETTSSQVAVTIPVCKPRKSIAARKQFIDTLIHKDSHVTLTEDANVVNPSLDNTTEKCFEKDKQHLQQPPLTQFEKIHTLEEVDENQYDDDQDFGVVNTCPTETIDDQQSNIQTSEHDEQAKTEEEMNTSKQSVVVITEWKTPKDTDYLYKSYEEENISKPSDLLKRTLDKQFELALNEINETLDSVIDDPNQSTDVIKSNGLENSPETKREPSSEFVKNSVSNDIKSNGHAVSKIKANFKPVDATGDLTSLPSVRDRIQRFNTVSGSTGRSTVVKLSSLRSLPATPNGTFRRSDSKASDNGVHPLGNQAKLRNFRIQSYGTELNIYDEQPAQNSQANKSGFNSLRSKPSYVRAESNSVNTTNNDHQTIKVEPKVNNTDKVFATQSSQNMKKSISNIQFIDELKSLQLNNGLSSRINNQVNDQVYDTNSVERRPVVTVNGVNPSNGLSQMSNSVCDQLVSLNDNNNNSITTNNHVNGQSKQSDVHDQNSELSSTSLPVHEKTSVTIVSVGIPQPPPPPPPTFFSSPNTMTRSVSTEVSQVSKLMTPKGWTPKSLNSKEPKIRSPLRSVSVDQSNNKNLTNGSNNTENPHMALMRELVNFPNSSRLKKVAINEPFKLEVNR